MGITYTTKLLIMKQYFVHTKSKEIDGKCNCIYCGREWDDKYLNSINCKEKEIGITLASYTPISKKEKKIKWYIDKNGTKFYKMKNNTFVNFKTRLVEKNPDVKPVYKTANELIKEIKKEHNNIIDYFIKQLRENKYKI